MSTLTNINQRLVWDCFMIEIEEFLYEHHFYHVQDKLSILKKTSSKDNIGCYLKKTSNNSTYYLLYEDIKPYEKRREKAFVMFSHLQKFFEDHGIYLGEYGSKDPNQYSLFYIDENVHLPIVTMDTSKAMEIKILPAFLEILSLKAISIHNHHNQISLLVLDNGDPKIVQKVNYLKNKGYVTFVGSYKEQINYFLSQKYLFARLISKQIEKKDISIIMNLSSKEKIESKDIEHDLMKFEAKEISQIYKLSLKEHLDSLSTKSKRVKLCNECATKREQDYYVLKPIFQILNIEKCLDCASFNTFQYYLIPKK